MEHIVKPVDMEATVESEEDRLKRWMEEHVIAG